MNGLAEVELCYSSLINWSIFIIFSIVLLLWRLLVASFCTYCSKLYWLDITGSQAVFCSAIRGAILIYPWEVVSTITKKLLTVRYSSPLKERFKFFNMFYLKNMFSLRENRRFPKLNFGSVQFSHLVVSDSLRPHESQHARTPCPSKAPGVYPNSCSSSRWCHPAISSSVIPFSSCPQSLPHQMSQRFAWGGQSIGVSASASVLPVNTKDWLPLGWTGWISCSPGESQESSPTPQFKHQFWCSAFFIVQLSHPYMATGKTIALTTWTIVD